VVDEGSPRIAFWNVRDLSMNNRDEVELSLITDVIEDYSLVALAEVSDDQVVAELEALLDARGDAWTYELSSRIGDSGASAEHYAFVWREADFRLTESRELPEVLTENGDRFDREPFLGVFESVVSGWQFALLNVHVTWGDGEEFRVAEVRALAQYYGPLAEEFDDVIIAGDLNLNSGDQEGIGWLSRATGLSDITAPSPATKVDSDNTYDHFLLDLDRTDEYTGVHGVDTFDDVLFPGNPVGASLAVSDHRPIWISVTVN
jgi:endonuclease/exonuclease/phosphatase family metal-dependent hydrolase